VLNPGAPLAFARANAWLLRAFGALDRSLPGAWKNARDANIHRRITRATANRYTASNRRTSELTGLDLRRWGYAS